MTTPFRAGMIGSGNICEFHVAAVKKLAPHVELVGICDLDPARAKDNAEKWGTTAYADLDALVAAGANVIHVLTPPSSHAKVARAALERGCHVLIEKPIAEDADEARQLVHDINVKVGPVLSNVEGAVGDARQLIQNVDGKIGPIASNIHDTAKEIQTLARSANEQVQPLSADAQETLKEAQKLLRGLDEKTTTLTSRIDEALKDAQHLVRNVDGEIGPIATSLKSTLASIEKAAGEAEVTLREAQQALKSVGGDLGEDSELLYEFKQALRDVRGLAKSIRDLADTLERQPESAIFGKKLQTGR